MRFGEIKSPHMPQESSAAHSWRLALMTHLVVDTLNLDIDKYHSLMLALAHDLPELVDGDIDHLLIAEKKVSLSEKYDLENSAMKKITGYLPAGMDKQLYNYWMEFEKGDSKEAKYVRALDKLETLAHLVATGWRTYDKPEFIANYANESVKEFPALKGLLSIIKQRLKSEFEKGNIPWKKEYEELK